MQQVMSNPEDRKAIFNAIREISDSYSRIEAERDLIKEILNTKSEDHEIPKKYLRKLAQWYHKQNFDVDQKDFETIGLLYESVVTPT